MAKKIILEYEDETNYQFVGIASSLKDYNLVFHINKSLNLKLERADDFILKVKNEEQQYSVFYFIDNINMTNFYLVSNKFQSINLVKGFKHFDYFIILDGEADEDDAANLAKKLKAIPGIILSSVANASFFDQVPELQMNFETYLSSILKSN